MSDPPGSSPIVVFLIPIQGLQVPHPWKVGRVVIHPGSDDTNLIPESKSLDPSGTAFDDRIIEVLDLARTGSLAEVRGCADIGSATDAVRESLDALRIFQLARRVTYTTSFGLPGDLYQSNIQYIAISGTVVTVGGGFHGDPTGWSFTQDAYDDWMGSPCFQFLSDSIADPTSSEGARRASIGAGLFARAAREHRSDLKMLGLVTALEAWLLERQSGPQTLRLVRHVTWFGCRSADGSLCGRSRPICPYLHLDPAAGRDLKRLTILRHLGNTSPAWRCSEWHRVRDWYDARSGAAHADPSSVDAKAANQAEYWIAHYLAEPILEWLRTHRDDPIGELQRTLGVVEDPIGWEAMVDALDSENPPGTPPKLQTPAS